MSNSRKAIIFVLLVLTIVMVGVAFYITTILQNRDTSPPDSSASPYGQGNFVNICGTSPASGNWAARGTACSGCTQNNGCSGTVVGVFKCLRGQESYENGGIQCTQNLQFQGTTASFSQYLNDPCALIQIDVWSNRLYGTLRDFVVWRGNRFGDASCTTTTPTPTPPPTVPACPTSIQPRFRVVANGIDQGLVAGGSWRPSEINTLEYLVVTDMQTNPPSFFNGTVVLNTPDGEFTNQGVASTRVITSRTPGTYQIRALFNGQLCGGTSITIASVTTPTPTSTPTNTPTPTLSITPTSTPTPTGTPTLTPTGSLSPTPTVPICGGICDPGLGPNACPQNHACVPNSQGGHQCAIQQCANDPTFCTPDLCTVISESGITKTGTIVARNENDAIVRYTLTVLVRGTSYNDAIIQDTLDTKVEDAWVRNISDSGSVSNGVITWTNQALQDNVPRNYTYEVVIPRANWGTYRNVACLFDDMNDNDMPEGSEQIDCDDETIILELNDTAIFTDNSSKLIMGIMLIVIGIIIYYVGFYEKIGKLFVNIAGKKIALSVSSGYAKKEFEKSVDKEE